jgi:hypothetical protein
MLKTYRLCVLLALGLSAAGCDRCGDFLWDSKSQSPIACKGGTGPSGL